MNFGFTEEQNMLREQVRALHAGGVRHSPRPRAHEHRQRALMPICGNRFQTSAGWGWLSPRATAAWA